MIERDAHRFGTLVFDRDAIVCAALRAYVESILAALDPRRRVWITPCVYGYWTGDLQRGAFDNRNGGGDHEVIAWTEAGVVGLAFELGFGPLEQLGLKVNAITGGPDDVRAAVPDLPAELSPAFLMAVSMLDLGNRGEKSAGVGFWLHGDRVAGSLFDDTLAAGANRLVAWGALQNGRLPLTCANRQTRALAAETERTIGAPIHALVDAVVARARIGPTELTTDELATLLPTPPDAEQLLAAQRSLQKVAITWPGSPEVPLEPQPTGISPFLRRS